MSLLLTMALVLLLFDAQNIFAVWKRHLICEAGDTCEDYTIIVPVYGHRRYFDSGSHLEPHRQRVLVALDMAGHGMEGLADELESEGWQVHRTRLPIPGPPALILDALESGRITTAFAFRMDSDTHPIDDPGAFVAEMRARHIDYASVRVHVRGPRRAVERIQALEYRMAMRGRRLRPWLSSGACYGGTTTSLRRVLRLHSMWFPGEDLEAGRIALALRLRVAHLDLRVETDAPGSWRALSRQRRSWWAGGFRHAVVNADKNLRHTPVWTFYNLGLVVLGVFLKVHGHLEVSSAYALARGFLVLFAVYLVLTLCANWPVRSWWMITYPPYALAQAIAMPSLGFVFWARAALEQRHLGRYRFGYRRGPDLRATSPAVPQPLAISARRRLLPTWTPRWSATAAGAVALAVLAGSPFPISTDSGSRVPVPAVASASPGVEPGVRVIPGPDGVALPRDAAPSAARRPAARTDVAAAAPAPTRRSTGPQVVWAPLTQEPAPGPPPSLGVTAPDPSPAPSSAPPAGGVAFEPDEPTEDPAPVIVAPEDPGSAGQPEDAPTADGVVRPEPGDPRPQSPDPAVEVGAS